MAEKGKALTADGQAIANRIGEVYEKLEALSAEAPPDVRARKILRGLQFTADMMATPTNRLSGGWRMRLQRRLQCTQALGQPNQLEAHRLHSRVDCAPSCHADVSPRTPLHTHTCSALGAAA